MTRESIVGMAEPRNEILLPENRPNNRNFYPYRSFKNEILGSDWLFGQWSSDWTI